MPTLPKWELKLPKLPASVLQVKKTLKNGGLRLSHLNVPTSMPKIHENTKMETILKISLCHLSGPKPQLIIGENSQKSVPYYRRNLTEQITLS